MNNLKQSGITVMLSLVAGFIGGILSHGGPVFAEKESVVPEVIKAKSFVLVGENGKPMGYFGKNENDEPLIRLYFKDGSTAATYGPGVILLDHEKQLFHVVIGANGEGAVVSMADKKMNPRAGLYLQKDGNAEITIQEPDGEGRISLKMDKLAKALSLTNSHDKEDAVLLLGGIGNAIATLNMSDKDGNPRLIFGISRGIPVVSIMNAEGKAVWNAP